MKLNANFLENKAAMRKEATNCKDKYPNAFWMFVNQSEARDAFSKLSPKKIMMIQDFGNDIAEFMSNKWQNGTQIAFTLDTIEEFAATSRELAGMRPIKTSFVQKLKQFYKDFAGKYIQK